MEFNDFIRDVSGLDEESLKVFGEKPLKLNKIRDLRLKAEKMLVLAEAFRYSGLLFFIKSWLIELVDGCFVFEDNLQSMRRGGYVQ